MSTAIAERTQSGLILAGEKEIDRMDSTLAEVEPAKIANLPRMRKALTVAKAMQTMRQLMQGEVMKDVMQLQGTELGFRTDKDSEGGYSENDVRDSVIAALMKGAQVCGNEFNIISKRSYLTKEFFERAVGEFHGLTDLKLSEGVPAKAGDAGALVSYIATWNLHGNPDTIRCERTDTADTRIPVKVNSRMGTDAILGKAKRKLLAKVYARLTGSAVGDFINESAESGEDVIDVEVAPAGATVSADEGPWQDTVGEDLEGCEQKSDVDAIYDQYRRLCDGDAELVQLDALCTERKEAIHNSRGERANT